MKKMRLKKYKYKTYVCDRSNKVNLKQEMSLKKTNGVGLKREKITQGYVNLTEMTENLE